MTIKVDGETLSCPTVAKKRVAPGKHAVIATGDALVPLSREVVASPGGSELIEIELASLDEALLVRRWSRWKPWVVVGAGIAATGTGVAFNVLARRTNAALAEGVTMNCGVPGCSDERYRALGYDALESEVRHRNRISLVALGIGGVALITGGVLVLLNRPALPKTERVTVVPSGTGLAIVGSF